MSWPYGLPLFLLGIGIGAYIERFRWLAWARREVPEKVDTKWL